MTGTTPVHSLAGYFVAHPLVWSSVIRNPPTDPEQKSRYHYTYTISALCPGCQELFLGTLKYNELWRALQGESLSIAALQLPMDSVRVFSGYYCKACTSKNPESNTARVITPLRRENPTPLGSGSGPGPVATQESSRLEGKESSTEPSGNSGLLYAGFGYPYEHQSTDDDDDYSLLNRRAPGQNKDVIVVPSATSER